jgi:hypothetical protein
MNHDDDINQTTSIKGKQYNGLDRLVQVLKHYSFMSSSNHSA